jgi:hypothetical protein
MSAATGLSIFRLAGPPPIGGALQSQLGRATIIHRYASLAVSRKECYEPLTMPRDQGKTFPQLMRYR